MRSRADVGAFVLGAMTFGAVVAMDPAGWSPFGPAKWAAVSTLGPVGGLLALRHDRRTGAMDRRLCGLWVGLIAALLIGALTNHDVPTALLGHPVRHLGVITWLLFWLLFVAGRRLDAASAGVVLRCAAAGVAVAGTYGVAQLLGWEPIALAGATRRLTTTFGSAAFTGASMSLLVPPTFGLALAARRWSARCAFGLAALLGTIALVGSGARAAWFGVAVSTVSCIAVTSRRPAPRRRWSLVLAGLAALVAVLSVAPRFGDLLARDHGTASRLDEWATAQHVLARHPVTGVGSEGYRIAVAEGIDARYERTYGRDVALPDRAHSGPLDVALAGGVPAALAHLALVGAVLVRSVRTMRSSDVAWRALALGVVACAVQQLLLFPVAEIDAVWWLLAGMAVAGSPGRRGAGRGASLRGRRVLTASAVAAGVVTAVSGVLLVAADRLAKSSIAAASRGDSANAIADAQRAVRLRPDVVTYRLVHAEALAGTDTLNGIDRAIAAAERALDWSPRDPAALDEHATLLLRRATVTGAASDITRAVDTWRRLVDRDPHRARWQLQLGRAAALDGDVDAARAAWTRAMTLAPDDPTPASLLDALGPP